MTDLSEEGHIEGPEFILWKLSRPDPTTAAENTNLDDGLIPRYDATKLGSFSPEDAMLIFWNRVSWHKTEQSFTVVISLFGSARVTRKEGE